MWISIFLKLEQCSGALLQSAGLFVVATFVFDVIHFSLHVCLNSRFRWLSRLASPHEAHHAFFDREFKVSNDVNRQGVRLEGPNLESRGTRELVSEGVANGAIQVASSGQAMILFCEQRTTGGYAKIANVIRADWHRIGQLAPGHSIRFKEVTLEQAWSLNRQLELELTTAVSEF